MIFDQPSNEEGEGEAYLGEGRRGASISTEVKWSRNPAQFSSLTTMLSFNMVYLGKRPPLRGSGKGSRGGGRGPTPPGLRGI